MRIQELKLGRGSIYVSETLEKMASIFMKRAKLDEALAMFKESLCIKQQKYGLESLKLISTIMALAITLRSQDWMDEAMALYNEV